MSMQISLVTEIETTVPHEQSKWTLRMKEAETTFWTTSSRTDAGRSLLTGGVRDLLGQVEMEGTSGILHRCKVHYDLYKDC